MVIVTVRGELLAILESASVTVHMNSAVCVVGVELCPEKFAASVKPPSPTAGGVVPE
jgi:hypothetical protein